MAGRRQGNDQNLFDPADIDAKLGDEVCGRKSNETSCREKYIRGLFRKWRVRGWSAMGGISGYHDNLRGARDNLFDWDATHGVRDVFSL